MNTTIDTYVVHRVLQFNLQGMIMCANLVVGIALQSVLEKSVEVKGQTVFLVKVKGNFDHFDQGCRSECSDYQRATPL